jgi:trafficking protein particle complex subunit 9
MARSRNSEEPPIGHNAAFAVFNWFTSKCPEGDLLETQHRHPALQRGCTGYSGIAGDCNMDGAAFASLAQIKILLVPVGKIPRQSFERWSTLVRSFEHIRLDEIPSETREDKSKYCDWNIITTFSCYVGRFISSPLAVGHLHLSYLSHPPPAWYNNLTIFRISQFPLGVIGIADCSNADSLTSILAEFKATLSELFPENSAFPLAYKCYAFENDDEHTQINLSGNLPDLVVIPSVMGNKQIYIGTLISELCADILGDFTGLVRK